MHMRFLLSLLLTVMIPAAACAGSGEIDRLLARLGQTPWGLWENGVYPILDLPVDTPVEIVVKRCFEMTAFNQGHAKQHTILETRQVKIVNSAMKDYTAVLVDSDLGRKIVLISFTGSGSGWWTRIYDAE